MKHHTKEKGDLAVTKVIADLTEKEFDILLPISENLPFDLIAYKDNISYRIQCKYASDGIADYKTSWADKKGNHTKKYSTNDFDFYGLYLPDIKICVYPAIIFKGHKISTQIPNSTTSIYWYEDFLQPTTNATRKTFKDFGLTYDQMAQSVNIGKDRLTQRKVIRPSKEELEKLLWEKPTSQLAIQFGVSDKAIEKWAKSYKISKPSRGYWSKH
jgi:hypothetical protein